MTAPSASAGESPSCVHASEHTSGSDLAERTARIEVGGERDRAAGIDELSGARHRTPQHERSHREKHADDVARRELLDPFVARRLEVVDGASAELDRERDRALLGELVTVQAKLETGSAACVEIAPCLLGGEGPALEKDVGRLGDRRSFGQDLAEREVEVGVGVAMLRWNGVRSEPGGDTALGCDRAQRRELGLTVEPVARLPFEGRRAGMEHPLAMPPDRGPEAVLAGRPSRFDGRQDPAPRGVELLVARPTRAKLELARAIPREAHVRVAVHEPWDRAETTAVELLDLSVERSEVLHATDLGDAPAVAEDERILEDVDLAQSRAAQRGVGPRGGDDLRQVAEEHP